MKILIVDNDPISVLLILNYLKFAKFNPDDIVHVNTGEKAIALYKENPSDFQFILMDVRLQSILTGYETTELIMNIAPVPIIVISANCTQDFPYAGHIDYLIKPFKKEQLIDILKKHYLI
jgi:CheY-like chemotaxis protein